MKGAFVLALAIAGAASAGPPTTCGDTDAYSVALCAYQVRDFGVAEARFKEIVERNEPSPVTLRSTYFLARTEMKLGRFEEAETLFIRIYETSRAFYEEWNCDYLLGACRKARGKG